MFSNVFFPLPQRSETPSNRRRQLNPKRGRYADPIKDMAVLETVVARWNRIGSVSYASFGVDIADWVHLKRP